MGISGITGFNNYRISSIHGNPYSMNSIERIGKDNSQPGKPLIIASKEQKEKLYIKDYGKLDATKNTITGDFAMMLDIQENMSMQNENTAKNQSEYTSYLNDTIGMMGLQNKLRDQLNGIGFTPFA